jgi:hypothetical protein
LAKILKTPLQQFDKGDNFWQLEKTCLSPGRNPMWKGGKKVKKREGFLMQMYKREKTLAVKNSKILKMLSIFSLVNLLEVDKSQDHLQEFTIFNLTNIVICQLLKNCK